MEEIIEENKKLKERIKYLENIINRGNSGAYDTIRGMIINKVDKEIDFTQYEEWQRKGRRRRFERKLMDDLLWEIRVRTVKLLSEEHIKLAEEYIKNYKFEEV